MKVVAEITAVEIVPRTLATFVLRVPIITASIPRTTIIFSFAIVAANPTAAVVRTAFDAQVATEKKNIAHRVKAKYNSNAMSVAPAFFTVAPSGAAAGTVAG